MKIILEIEYKDPKTGDSSVWVPPFNTTVEELEKMAEIQATEYNRTEIECTWRTV